MPYAPSGSKREGRMDGWMDIVINVTDDINIKILLNLGKQKECYSTLPHFLLSAPTQFSYNLMILYIPRHTVNI
jgi:hypothetical protein